MKNKWVGIDYGSKLAGTTVICYLKDDKLCLISSAKGKDADKWLADLLGKIKTDYLFFDAPLSLPAAFFDKGEDYFYRQCDKETSAMSPMFLGGLTARAMRLKSQLAKYKFVESYPSYLIKNVFDKKEVYTKKKKYDGQLDDFLSEKIGFTFNKKPINWHEVDAVLCWISGKRYFDKISLEFGNKDEGVIIV